MLVISEFQNNKKKALVHNCILYPSYIILLLSTSQNLKFENSYTIILLKLPLLIKTNRLQKSIKIETKKLSVNLTDRRRALVLLSEGLYTLFTLAYPIIWILSFNDIKINYYAFPYSNQGNLGKFWNLSHAGQHQNCAQ